MQLFNKSADPNSYSHLVMIRILFATKQHSYRLRMLRLLFVGSYSHIATSQPIKIGIQIY